MQKHPQLPRVVLLGLAALFAAATILYSVIWMYYVRQPTWAELGMYLKYSIPDRNIEIVGIMPDGNIERAGLRLGDKILALNGRKLDTMRPYYDLVDRGSPGDPIELTALRAGSSTPETLALRLDRPRGLELMIGLTPSRSAAMQIMLLYPLPFLAVGLAVLFLRLDDGNAWLLASLFGGFIASAGLPDGVIHPTLRGFAMSYHVLLGSITPALFYYFFAVFPARSPLERRAPWLKWIFAAWLVVMIPLAIRMLILAESSGPVWLVIEQFKEPFLKRLLTVTSFGFAFLGQGLGLVSLALNGVYGESSEVRRKARVIGWGVLAGLSPMLLLIIILLLSKGGFQEIPFWPWALSVIALSLLPLSFAYAVVKYRVMEIPVLLRRSARYVLVQRGFLFLIFLSSAIATILFAKVLSQLSAAGAQVTIPAGLTAGVGLGVVLAAAGARIHQRVSQRIDRAFFRSAYDARQILESLAEKTRRTIRRDELAALLGGEISQALHPLSVIVYLEGRDGQLRVERDRVPPRFEPLSADLPLLLELARRGEPWEVPPLAEASKTGAEDFCVFGTVQPECLVPMQGRDGHLVGLVALGSRLSEEPYSREDKRLLAAVANQAGVAVESMRLAEQMAERMEAERRSALEMDFAKQVQAKLFPQRIAPVETLEYQGGCLQAREVGGDYYDFLNLGPGRVGLVLADVAGKGISAALMMANLQANLRSQYGAAMKDLPGLLSSVNRLFYESTPPSHYATLFFGDYEDSKRLIRYANCGHNPPMLLREDGSVERLGATGTVLGLFEGWHCSIGETPIAPGDTLVIFSDGVTEAESDEGEFFGESRLLETLTANRHLPVAGLLDAIVRTVVQFSGREQEDDLTLVVARSR